MLFVKGLIRGVFQIALFATLLLVPAGTWQWPRAIQFLAMYGVVAVGSILVMARFAPASLEARLRAPTAKAQPVADRVITLLLVLSIFAWIVFIPIDVHRLQLLPEPPLWLSILGAALFVAGFGVIITTAIQNAFAIPVVADQSESGQILIDTGLYSRVRHPLYLGLLGFLMGMGLWLESYASLMALGVPLVFLIARIVVEEKTLRATLPAYDDYTRRVRQRLVPFVW